MIHPAGYWSDPGRRPTNQDAVIRAVLGEGVEVAAVADGMGGHAAGEVASREALRALVAALRRGAGLREAVHEANRLVYRQALASPELQGMGTTLVAYLRRGREYEIGNVGDSRAYLLDGGTIRRLTRDHTFVAEAVASGELTEEEARRSRWRNALTRAVGTEPEVEADIFGPFGAERSHSVLLCTDGLHRWLAESEIVDLVAAAPDPGSAPALLGEAALRGGSDDNVTVLLVEVAPDAAAIPALASGLPPEPAPGLPPRLAGWANVLRPQAQPGLVSRATERVHTRRRAAGQGARRSNRSRRGERQGHPWEPLAFAVVVLGVLVGVAALLLRLR
jgi:protein phosphatase